MAAFEAEAEVICLLLRLDSVLFLVSWPQCIYGQLFWRKQWNVMYSSAQLLTHRLRFVSVAMHFLEIEAYELADLYQDTWN